MRKFQRLCALTIAAACGAAALAQDSTAIQGIGGGGCLPGDAVSPWADASAPLGSEQVNSFIVELTPFVTSGGSLFGIAPIVKASKTTNVELSSLISAQALSRIQRRGTAFVLNADTAGVGAPNASVYSLWGAPGFGVNNDPAINAPPPVVRNMTGKLGNQFALTFAEFSTTSTGQSYNAVIGAVVNYLPNNPGRLYVTRYVAAANSCDSSSNLSQFGIGSVDETGVIMLRADGNAVTGGCGLTPLAGNTDNNIYKVSMAARDGNKRNVVSNNFPAGQFDAGATEWLVRNSTVVYGTPNVLPTGVRNSTPLMLTGTFNNEYARGPAFGSITVDTTQLVAASQRGAMAYMTRNCGLLGGTHGTMGSLQRTGATANQIGVWGIDAAGGVTGKQALVIPAGVTDNDDGFNNLILGPVGEFDHYHSQTAFRGGNSQVALNVDRQGSLLAAGVVHYPGPGNGGNDNPLNFIAVARLNCGSGQVEWTMAGWNDGIDGKKIYDASNNVIGRMQPLFNVTGGSPLGPSMSAPMIDSLGNVWFISAVELFNAGGGPSDFDSALLRARYDAATFSYKLELVLEPGQVFLGANSGLPYRVNFLSIADSDSVDSGTAWSQNISELAHMGIAPGSSWATSDPRGLGGLIINAEIIYDSDQDGMFNKCTGAGTGNDQAYRVALYIGALDVCPGDLNGDGVVSQADLGILLGDFGCASGNCAGDLNNDGVVNQIDLGILLSVFGQSCL